MAVALSTPSAFISYSWDGENHKTWVRQLATRLAESGVEVSLDQWQVAPGESVTQFMETGVAQCEFILAVCTPRFCTKAEQRSGGVGYEQQIVSGALLSGTPRAKFIPVLRTGSFDGTERAIPAHFAGVAAIDFRDDANFDNAVEDLLRAIYRRPRHQRPVRGQAPTFVNDGTSQPSTSVSATTFALELTEDLTPVHGRAALEVTVHEILEAIRQKDIFTVKVIMESLDSTRAEIATLSAKGDLSIAERERRRTLRDRVSALGAYGVPFDLLLADLLVTMVTNVGVAKTSAVLSIAELVQVIQDTFDLYTPADWPSGVKFDTFPKHMEWYAGFYVDRAQAEKFAENEGVPLGMMTAGYGLRLTNLPREAVRRRAIPMIMFELFRQRYGRKNEPANLREFFEFDTLLVGLG